MISCKLIEFKKLRKNVISYSGTVHIISEFSKTRTVALQTRVLLRCQAPRQEMIHSKVDLPRELSSTRQSFQGTSKSQHLLRKFQGTQRRQRLKIRTQVVSLPYQSRIRTMEEQRKASIQARTKLTVTRLTIDQGKLYKQRRLVKTSI